MNHHTYGFLVCILLFKMQDDKKRRYQKLQLSVLSSAHPHILIFQDLIIPQYYNRHPHVLSLR